MRTLLAALLVLSACDRGPAGGEEPAMGAALTPAPTPGPRVAASAAVGTWTVTGVVEDIGGTVAGALVYSGSASTRSGARGEFSLDLPAASAPVAIYARAQQQVGCARTRGDPVRITIAATLTLAGRVVDDRTGAPIRAWVQRPEQPPIRCAPDGRFWISGLEPAPTRGLMRARVQLGIVEQGYEKAWRDVRVRAGSRLEVRLIRRRHLHGRVLDPRGRTQIDARVGLCDEPFGDLDRRRDAAWMQSGTPWHVQSTDRAGRFYLGVTERHRYLAVKARGFPRHDFFVGRGTPTKVTITLRPGGVLQGRLVRPDGGPVRGRTVYAAVVGQEPFSIPSEGSLTAGVAVDRPGLHPIRLGNPVARGVTARDGAFRLDVAQGTYDLYADRNGEPVLVGRRVWTGAPRRVVLPPPEAPAPTGRVIFQVRRADGRRLSGAVVLLRPDHPARRVPWDPYEGDLRTAPGRFTLWFLAAGHRPKRYELTARGGERINLGYVFLQPGGAAVRVRIPRREPYGRVRVRVTQDRGVRQEAQLGSHADEITLSGLRPGAAGVRATLIDDRPEGGAPLELGPVRVELSEGRIVRVEVPLR